jgi:hypothetical protein
MHGSREVPSRHIVVSTSQPIEETNVAGATENVVRSDNRRVADDRGKSFIVDAAIDLPARIAPTVDCDDRNAGASKCGSQILAKRLAAGFFGIRILRKLIA